MIKKNEEIFANTKRNCNSPDFHSNKNEIFPSSSYLNRNIASAEKEYGIFQSLSQSKCQSIETNSTALDCMSGSETTDDVGKLKASGMFIAPLHGNKNLFLENKYDSHKKNEDNNDKIYIKTYDNNEEFCAKELPEKYSNLSLENEFDKDNSITKECIDHINFILDSDQQNSHDIYNPAMQTSDFHSQSSNHSHEKFFEKLSKLHFNKAIDNFGCNAFTAKRREEISTSNTQFSSKLCHKIQTTQMSPSKNNVIEDSYDSCNRPISLLSSLLTLKKKRLEAKFTSPSYFCQESVECSGMSIPGFFIFIYLLN